MANPSQTTAAPSAAPTILGRWLTRGTEGRFSAYIPRGGEVLRWTEGTDGSWSGPVSLGGDITDVLSVGQGKDRYVHLVGLRPTDTGEGHVEFVHTTQYQTGRPALAWKGIGHSNGKAPWRGNPAVTVDAIGRAYVFTRNGGGGISCRAQKDAGGFHPWWDLNGRLTDPSPVALTNGQGFVELLTANNEGLARYVQESSGGKPVREPIVPAEVTFGTLAGLTGPSGHTTLYYRDKEGRICAWSPGRDLKPTPFADAVGTGPLSVVRCLIDGFDCTVLAQQAENGRLALAAYPSEQEDAGATWAETGEPRGRLSTVLTRDRDGRLVVAVLEDGARIYLTRQKAGAEGLLLEAWRTIA